MARVVIVEDHRMVADMVAAMLVQQGVDSYVVMAEATSGPREFGAVLECVLRVQPELALVDLDLGTAGDGIDLIPALVASGIRVLVVCGSTDRLCIAKAVEAGAIGYQPKAQGIDALLAAVRAALDGSSMFDAVDRDALLRELRQHRDHKARELAPFEQLTNREREVLEALAEGLSVSEIAQTWVVSDTTVRSHVRAILSKLGRTSQLGAVAAALRAGWLHRSRRFQGMADSSLLQNDPRMRR